MNSDRRNRLILVLLLTAAALVVIYTAGISRLTTMIEAERSSEASIRKRLAEQSTIAKQAGALGDDADNRAPVLKSVETRMPTGDVYSWLLSHLEPLADQEGIRDLKVTRPLRRPEAISTQVANLGYIGVAGSLNAVGEYGEIGRFLAAIENGLPLMRLTSVTIDATGIGIITGSGSETALEFQLSYEGAALSGSALE